MTSCRLASANRSSSGMRGRHPSGEFAEYGTDRHTEAGEVAFRQNVTGHNFSRRVDIGKWPAVASEDAARLVHRDTHVSEGDAGAQRKAVKRRPVDGNGPIAFRRSEPASGVAILAQLGVSGDGAIILFEGVLKNPRIETHGGGNPANESA